MPQKRSPVIRSQPQKQLRERGSQRRKNGSFLAPAKPLSDNGGVAAVDRALLILGAFDPEALGNAQVGDLFCCMSAGLLELDQALVH